MTKIDQERVVVFRRILNGKLLEYSDEELLSIMNSAIFPNSLSKTALKYTFISGFIFHGKELTAVFEKIKRLYSVLNKIEKDLFKFGVLYGFDSSNANYQYNRFISNSLILEKSLIGKKQISSSYFEGIFKFIYLLIYRGEKNERFPRI